MRSFIYTTTAIDTGIKIVGQNVLITINYVGATNLILYIAGGHTPDASTMSEIVDSSNIQFTRFTANGTGSQKLNISGLTPGIYIAFKSASGTGTATATIQTGGE